MPDADVALVPEFEPPAREAWLALVAEGAQRRRLREAPCGAHGRRPARAAALHPQRHHRGGWRHGPHGVLPRRMGHPPAPCRAGPQDRQRRHPGGPRRRGDLAAAADHGARPGRPLLRCRAARGGAERRVPRGLRRRARCAREHHGRGRQPDRDLARGGDRREPAARRLQLRSARRAGPHRHALLSGPALLRDRRQVRLRLPHHDPRHGAAGRRAALSRSRRRRGPGAGGDAGDAGRLPARLRERGAEAALRLQQDRAGAGSRRRSVPDHRQAARRASSPRVSPRRAGPRMPPTGCTCGPPLRSA